ncbi:MAG: prepilin peptidase [Candidatus Pacebacteria bacterium]|jgi:prepilin signal peptidase PulO-like enzyme (type II secretory pathway)|nr:prepilin peptidase [Candidatus Paceibacterota bacterium]
MSLSYFLICFFFLLGAIIGSFLNVVIDRADLNESPLKGGSYCPHCQKSLAWWELIPILSFFFLKGKCSSCEHKLSWQYPLVEIITGLLFMLTAMRFLRFAFFSPYLLQHISLENILIISNCLFWLFWVSVLVIISVYDFKKYLILSEVLIPSIVITLFWRILIGFLIQKNSFYFLPYFFRLLGNKSFIFGYYSYFIALFTGIVFFCGIISLLAWVTKEKAMGWGDAILAFFLGSILGWPESLIALIIAFLIGGGISLILIIFKKKTMKSFVPFAPFLSIGALTTMLFGDIIIEMYLLLIL